MRAHEFLDEIVSVNRDNYRGGAAALRGEPSENLYTLPYKPEYSYSVNVSSRVYSINLWDPSVTTSKPANQRSELAQIMNQYIQSDSPKYLHIGNYFLEKFQDFPLPNAVQGQTITVHEKYRGQGLAMSMYLIAINQLKLPLISGDTQTPGGQKNWVNLWKSQTKNNIEVLGWVSVPKTVVSTEGKRLERIGAKLIGSNNWVYYSFKVEPNSSNTRLVSAVKSRLSNVYGRSEYNLGFYAVAR